MDPWGPVNPSQELRDTFPSGSKLGSSKGRFSAPSFNTETSPSPAGTPREVWHRFEATRITSKASTEMTAYCHGRTYIRCTGASDSRPIST
ncbi:hypothetical protein BDW67DRAFT_159071 [Aspergillus spinulosporus]